MRAHDFFEPVTSQVRGRRVLAHYDTLDSTNDEAWRGWRARRFAPGTVVCAARQTAGRGFDGSRWESDAAVGLWMSLLERAPGVQTLPLRAALAVARCLRRTAGVDAHVKWPNDVLVGPRKIAGILVESTADGGGAPLAVIGVGVNLNQPSFSNALADVAVSVSMLTGRELEPRALLDAWLEEWDGLPRDADAAVRAWEAHSRMVGRAFELRSPRETEHVVILGLTREGALRVRDGSGREREVLSRRDLDLRGVGEWWRPRAASP